MVANWALHCPEAAGDTAASTPSGGGAATVPAAARGTAAGTAGGGAATVPEGARGIAATKPPGGGAATAYATASAITRQLRRVVPVARQARRC